MRGIRVLVALFALFIAACGSGSIKSPDFSSGLLSLNLSPLNSTVAAGETVQLTLLGTYSEQPGKPSGTRAITEASYTVTPSGIATVDATGLVTTTAEGTATITATVGGKSSNAVTVNVGAPALTGIVVRTRAPNGTVGDTGDASIGAGTQQGYMALGLYSNNTTDDLPGDVTVTWESTNTDVATVAPAAGVITNATAVDQGTSQIQATATVGDDTFEASGTLTVTTAALIELIRLEPVPASVAAGQSWQFQAIGRFQPNTEQPVDNAQLDWTSADNNIATVNASGLATGVAFGNTDITATLKTGVVASGTQRSASAQLSVGNAACTDALLASEGATVTTDRSPICDLTCRILEPDNVIDADLTNFANVQAAVALLGANASITVAAEEGTTFAASTGSPRTTGFILGRPRGQLLSAQLLASRKSKVTTLLDGVVQETFEDAQVLRVSLLGILLAADSDIALVSVQATKDFDALRFTYGGGVISALSSVRVFSACSTATPTEPAP